MNEKNERENPPNSQANQNDTRPVIVTIGASAGGVSALHHFFEALPEQSGAAYVVVVHLDPVHRSEMPAILAAKTNASMPRSAIATGVADFEPPIR